MTQQRPAALVTGAATGIGRSAALALARAGYDVAINYSQSATAAKETAAQADAAGARTLLCRCDVSDEASVGAMLAAVREKFGRLDVLVNNAGTTTGMKHKDLDSISGDEWDRVFAVNVKSVFLVTRAAAPMLRESHGCIVNTASIVGLRPGPQPLRYGQQSSRCQPHQDARLQPRAGSARQRSGPGWMEGDWMRRMLGKYRERWIGARS
jgi:3-oxoacyl-[acyl-carrier protein] reductase